MNRHSLRAGTASIEKDEAARKKSSAARRTRRDDLHATRVSFAFALCAQAGKFREREMNDASLPWAHRIERDDLPLADGLLAELEGDRGETSLTAGAITFDV